MYDPNVLQWICHTAIALCKAGGCLDGKQHLSIEGLSGATGMKTLANAIGTAAPSGDAEKKPGKGGKGKKPKKEGEKDTAPPKAETGYVILVPCSLYVLYLFGCCSFCCRWWCLTHRYRKRRDCLRGC